jgi:alginate O-acetyltransferase complex protein AlgI
MMQYIHDHIGILYVFLAFLIFLCIHYIAKKENLIHKKLLIITVSSMLILYLDPVSFLILLTFSTILLIAIKKQLSFNVIIYPMTLLLILALLIIKDYSVVFDISNPYVPLGISYYYFRLLSLFIEYAKRPHLLSQIDILHYFTYVFFFPVFLAGPIQKFQDFKTIEPDNYFSLYRAFLVALALKLFVVDMLLHYLAYEYFLNRVNALATLELAYLKTLAIISVFGFTAFLHAYMDLMLYTEMSKSLSRILGFSIQENFNKPLLASNISKFWQSWHMSLSNWTRDYIFFPTLLKTKRIWLSTYVSMLTIGLWHSATINWIAWALLHATALNFYSALKEQTLFKKIASTKYGSLCLKLLGNIVTLYFVSIVFIFVAIHDIQKVFAVLQKLFGM